MAINQLLKGKIVTMTSEAGTYESGYIYIVDGIIQGIYNNNKLPANLKSIPIIDTMGVIYPGMMDLHNHFVYNVLPLWVVPKKYQNRSQWPSNAEYQSAVSEPIKQVLSKYSESSKAIVRYVEAKALMSGTTTGQGIRTQVDGSVKLFQGAMRNVEEPDESDLPAAGTLVPDLFVGGASGAARIATFRKALNRPGQLAYFYHLAEGIDNVARQHFLDLKKNDLINEHLVGIHCLGLSTEDLAYFASKRAKLVWSPFSNQLLYGQTLDLKSLKASGLLFSIGCDWSPSGSKNLLEELKVAYQANTQQGNIFSNYELVSAVTSSPAQILGWDKKLGTLETNKIADLLIVADNDADVYKNLILAKEEDVYLVMVGGIARFGTTNMINDLVLDKTNPPELVVVNGQNRLLYLFSNGSELNDLSFGKSWKDLISILNDLKAFVQTQKAKITMHLEGVISESPTSFKLVLDNEFKPEKDPAFPKISEEHLNSPLVKPPMQNSIILDAPFASGTDYWLRVTSEQNISKDLISWLKTCYGI